MSVGRGDCIGGSHDVGANGIECGAQIVGCSPVVCVSFYTVASPCALRAQRGWRSVVVTGRQRDSWVHLLHPFAPCSGVWDLRLYLRL